MQEKETVLSKEDKTSLFIKGDKKESFPITHVNVRTSIVFLIAKLTFLDTVATLVALLAFGAFTLPGLSKDLQALISSFAITYFPMLAVVKILLALYVVLQWINEYYEITPERIVYRRGIVWRKVDIYDFVHIRSLGVQQGVLGRILNFGSISIFDRGVYKYYFLNYIHNPIRYFNLLHQLIPDADIEKDVVREHVRDVGVE